MTRVCEKYRDRALAEGMNSRAAEIWRAHSRNCPQCRQEIYLLSMLGETVADSRQHIQRKDYERLIQTVRDRSTVTNTLFFNARKYFGFHSLGQTAAIIGVFFAVAFSGSFSRLPFSYDGQSENGGSQQLYARGEVSVQDRGMDERFVGEEFILGDIRGIFYAGAAAAPEEPPRDLPLWDSTAERNILELRNNIEDQRQFYSGMIDRELHE